jgi:hypothetical protein
LCGLGCIVESLNQSLSRVLQLAHWWSIDKNLLFHGLLY